MKNVDDIISEAAETFKQRRQIYGDNYKKVGWVFEDLFPDGITLTTGDDHDRFHILSLIIVKLTRYVQNWEKGGHEDSIHDMGIYAFMLEKIDYDLQCKQKEQK